jgi:hypothetical protein
MKVTIKVYNYGEYWEARIGYWWVARGNTKKLAIKNVIHRMETELSYR